MSAEWTRGEMMVVAAASLLREDDVALIGV